MVHNSLAQFLGAEAERIVRLARVVLVPRLHRDAELGHEGARVLGVGVREKVARLLLYVEHLRHEGLRPVRELAVNEKRYRRECGV